MDDLINFVANAQIPVRNRSRKCPYVEIIDPGHGGIIDGKYVTAPDKMWKHPGFTFYEGVFNRAVAWRHAQDMFANNRSYEIVVYNNHDISRLERVARAKDIHKEALKAGFKTYYHSIHGNAFGVQSVKGVEVYTSPGTTKSDPVATVYYYQLAKLGWNMRPCFQDGDPDKEARFTVLTETPMPAILSETGFFSNPEEAKLMSELFTVNQIALLMTQADQRVQQLNLLG